MAGVYVHIPFCASRCSYCDFFSTLRLDEVGHDYVEALIAEARLRKAELNGEPVKTLYMGGGTPSQLPLPLLARLIDGLKATLDLNAVQEFTLEANPDDVTPEWSAAVRALGVNRVSMGVQSFQDAVLRLVGRRHTARQAIDAVASLRHAGIDNISIDLIYGLPGQTLETWAESVRQAVDLRPQSEDQYLDMYRILVGMLQTAGYEHYEISNFALPGYRSRHNSSYWNETPYLGLGAAAHSYDGTMRRSNPADLCGYIRRITSGQPACQVEDLAWWERYDERVMLGLRTADGVDAHRLRSDFGDKAWAHFVSEARRHIDAGNMICTDDGIYILTSEGIVLSDSVMRDLMWDD